MIISPIFYMGNKRKICEELVSYFPKEIDTFYDLFSGSAVMSMNTNAKKYVLNDIDNHVCELYNIFKRYNYIDIINHITRRIYEFDLPKERSKGNNNKNIDRNVMKKNYENLRDLYNNNFYLFRDLDFYTLMFFSFSQQFRFSKKGNFNMPFGNDCFSEKNKEYIKNGCKFFQKENIKTFNKTFDCSQIRIGIKKTDFVYLDPPYMNTTATYNEGRGQDVWNMDSEKRLFQFCECLTTGDIKFGMSNVFTNKNIVNQHLIEWVEKNNLFVTHLNKKYNTCGKKSFNTDEVFITNYEVEKQQELS